MLKYTVLAILLLTACLACGSEDDRRDCGCRPRPKPKPKPKPKPTRCPPPITAAPRKYYTKNPFYKDIQWTLEDCVCRPFQNSYVMKKENNKRLRAKKTPLVPISKHYCRTYFTPKACTKIYRPVCAEFPRRCGKGAFMESKTFPNLCELRKHAALKCDPYNSYTYVKPKPQC